MEFFSWLGCVLASDTFRGLVLISGVVVAIVSVWSARIVARKKQAADMMFVSRNDNAFDEGLACISRLHNATDANIRALAAKDNKDKDDSKSIRYVLNHLEALSVGVQAGIYDEKMLKAAMFGTIVQTHKYASPYIDKAREETGRNTLYQEVRWLAERWEKKPLKPR